MLWISLAAVCDCSVCGEYIHLNVWRFLCRVVSSCVILTNAGETSQRLLSLNRCMHSCDVVDGNRFKSDLWLGICYIYFCCEDSVVFLFCLSALAVKILCCPIPMSIARIAEKTDSTIREGNQFSIYSVFLRSNGIRIIRPRRFMAGVKLVHSKVRRNDAYFALKLHETYRLWLYSCKKI